MIRRHSTAQGRFYVDTDTGERWPSVTTVLSAVKVGTKDKALMRSYATKTAWRAVDNVEELWERIHRDGKDSAAKWLSAAPEEHMQQARTRGDALHTIVDRRTRGEHATTTDPTVSRMVEQWEQWCRDWGVDIVAPEAVVINRTTGYGGTADWFGICHQLDDALVIGDYKTGTYGPYPSAALQLAAYAWAELWTPGGDLNSLEPFPWANPDVGYIVKVRPHGVEMYRTVQPLSDLFRTFTAMVHVHRWGQLDKKDVFDLVDNEAAERRRSFHPEEIN
ncbi:hypothetical protein GCM10012275_28730 [Longimycelium tulufanense]|uniref:PD-(D/E)XK endonuclease-like domain-containing protein n=1 Tax=Longimycelium tulufanense TaxID=907463 RepID=A0A8J3FV75_9PSEU|nr:hypothetical protein [Longimycelium tulufanense]GGM55860.1 hypothetical protein GCM10012275_28730 [Longimycelium tulufanense]